MGTKLALRWTAVISQVSSRVYAWLKKSVNSGYVRFRSPRSLLTTRSPRSLLALLTMVWACWCQERVRVTVTPTSSHWWEAQAELGWGGSWLLADSFYGSRLLGLALVGVKTDVSIFSCAWVLYLPISILLEFCRCWESYLFTKLFK